MNNIHRSSFAILCDKVHETLLTLGDLELRPLHAALQGEVNGDQLRQALDALRQDRRLMVLRDSKSVTRYRALVAPVQVAAPKIEPKPATVAQTPAAAPAAVAPPAATSIPQGAKSGSAAPASRPKPRPEGGAAPMPPSASPKRAARGTFRAQVLEPLEEKGPMDRHQIAAASGRNAQHVSVLMSELKLSRAVKTDGKVPARFALPHQDFPPLEQAAAAPRRIANLERKVAVLDRLSKLLEASIAAELREIRQDLTGAAA